jgi:hypothetical protein
MRLQGTTTGRAAVALMAQPNRDKTCQMAHVKVA